ncbi:hypothetical protein [Liquorilactobacillus oeni]|nr:hypothetical protein [Liquorilactobacillus oeni]
MKSSIGFWAKLSLIFTALQFAFILLKKYRGYKKRNLHKNVKGEA